MERRVGLIAALALLLQFASVAGWAQTNAEPAAAQPASEEASGTSSASPDDIEDPPVARPPGLNTGGDTPAARPAPQPARRRLSRRRGAPALSVQTEGPQIPPALQPWVAWALHGSPNIVCPDVAGSRVCRWPGTLRVDADNAGASFRLDVYADRRVQFALPGNKEWWPQEVTIDGAAPPVLSVGDVPTIDVPPGSHRIEGTFYWQEVPEILAVPVDVGAVDLTLDGVEVARPRVDVEGRLWLRNSGGEGAAEEESDSVRASLYRRFYDGVPMKVVTHLRLKVSGRAREVELGNVLLDGSRPTAVRAQFPVQVASDGATKVYVRPGSHDVEIDAVLPVRVEAVTAPSPGPDFYDPQEVWVWVPDESVRSVELAGLTAVDPERTSLPSDWWGYTTYLAEPASKLDLKVTRRGVSEAAPNDLRLSRDIWLDLDGQGFTIRDHITGTLHDDWRLNYRAADARLGRVSQHGENLLITEEPTSGLPGVELRDANVALEAELRVARGSLAIVGWDHDVQRLSANLHLPPGWMILGGSGVDTMRGTWLESWTLLDFFFMLMIAVAVGRLFGRAWAIVAILALGLAHGEVGAPQWVWVHLIATLALLRVLPRGWWRKLVVAYRWVAIVALALIMAPFVHDQLIQARHPQVSSSHGDPGDFTGTSLVRKSAPMAPPAEHFAAAEPMADGEAYLEETEAEDYDETIVQQVQQQEQKQLLGRSDWGSGGGGYTKKAKIALQQVDPNAVVQTGPGLPSWSWNSWHLQWTGPVGKDHVIELWLLSPPLAGLLGILRAFLLIFLGLLLIAPRDMFWEVRQPVPLWWRRLFGSGAPIGAALIALGIGVAGPTEVTATEIPDETTLQQIRTRWAQSTTCPDPCVVASSAEIIVDGLSFQMRAEVSAARDTAWTLPGPADVLRVQSVDVDGSTTNQLRRIGGLLQVRLSAGHHQVIVEGVLADRNSATIQFDAGTRPRFVTFDAVGWAVDGVSRTGVPDNSLQLTRTARAPDETADSAPEHAELPPWYTVERRVALGMPWELHTTVRRNDAQRPQLVKIPLVHDEKVITEGVRVEAGFALVDLARNQTEFTYTAELAVAPTIELSAALDKPWTETWIVECSRIWRCSFSQLPPVSTVGDGGWQPRWLPWPGESLQIAVNKPQGASGDAKTVDGIQYEVTPGKRLLRAQLGLTVRASQGAWQEVEIPVDAKLQSVKIDGVQRTIRPDGQTVRLPVQPGESRFELQWQQPWERGITERVPSISIGSPAANIETSIRLGGERWLLAASGDGMPWGPAILFWWTLALIAIVAALLGAVPNLPMKWWEWGLVAVGLAQLPPAAMVPIVLWFVILSWRRQRPYEAWWRFDLVQMAIVGLTLVAIVTMYAAAHSNLVLEVDMQVAGYGSTTEHLRWYADRADGRLPSPSIVSLPIPVYRGLSFLWALWAVLLIVRSARWGWSSFSSGGWWKFPSSSSRTVPTTPTGPEAQGEQMDDEEVKEPEEEIPPVPRNATDGVLVHSEFDLSQARRIGGSTTPAADNAEAPAAEADVAAPEPLGGDDDDELTDSELGALNTDEIIGALVDDSDDGSDDDDAGDSADEGASDDAEDGDASDADDSPEDAEDDDADDADDDEPQEDGDDDEDER